MPFISVTSLRWSTSASGPSPPDKWMTVQGLTILMIVAMAVGLHVVAGSA